MYLDPKKNYSAVRVRKVDYRTKAMIDMSLPFECFDETEIVELKKMFQTICDDIKDTSTFKSSSVAGVLEESDKAMESAFYGEEEKDGEE